MIRCQGVQTWTASWGPVDRERRVQRAGKRRLQASKSNIDARRTLLRRFTLDDVGRITAEQMVELARFVDQVNPDVLQQILSMLA